MSFITINDTFATPEEAKCYWDRHFGGCDWECLSTLDQCRALTSATDYLNNLAWKGDKTDCKQKLAFPRTGICCEGCEICDKTIPPQIIEATIRLALSLVKGEFNPNANVGVNPIKSQSVGRLKVEYNTDVKTRAVGDGCDGKLVNADPIAFLYPLLSCFLRVRKPIITGRICRT